MFKISPSIVTVVVLFLFLTGFRMFHIDKKEISWDVFGYYLPLPAAMIYNDPGLENREWVEDLNKKKGLSGTTYQITSNDEGRPMYFFLFGMSIFYAPFFILAHWYAGLNGFQQDGFSEPYQIFLVIGGLLYTLIGLYYWRKVLLHFFNEKITVILILLIVIGTNYTHHITLKNLETVNVLFTLSVILIWNTIRWHEDFRFINLLFIGISSTLMALVKPSEMLIIFLPLLWQVTDKKSLKLKWEMIRAHKSHFFMVILICIILAFPQLYYWKIKTGHLLYDTYKNPGVGLDFMSPHFLEVLFSYRKGWLIYTPIMIFSLIGFVFMKKHNYNIFPAILFSFFLSFYIVASWTEWWYGAGFSNRPLITYYGLLSIPFGYFLVWLDQRSIFYRIGFACLASFFLILNQFQWWQLRNYILDPYRTTKAYYWASFLKTRVSEKDRELLLVNRDFSGNDSFSDSLSYRPKVVMNQTFNSEKGGKLYSGQNEEFTMPVRIPYQTLTSRDHVWIKVSFDYVCKTEGEAVLAALCMERKEGAYGYRTFELENSPDVMKTKTIWFLTPEIRDLEDIFKIDIWKRSPSEISIDNLQILAFEKMGSNN